MEFIGDSFWLEGFGLPAQLLPDLTPTASGLNDVDETALIVGLLEDHICRPTALDMDTGMSFTFCGSESRTASDDVSDVKTVADNVPGLFLEDGDVPELSYGGALTNGLEGQGGTDGGLVCRVGSDSNSDTTASCLPTGGSNFMIDAGAISAAELEGGTRPEVRIANENGVPFTDARQRTGVEQVTQQQQQTGRTPKLRYSKGAAPSKYCHVCGRSAKTVSVALCGNNSIGLCRKVVCDKCLLMHQRDFWEIAKGGGGAWTCMHCRNMCPERARCHQYQRNNMRRRMRGGKGRSGKTEGGGGGGGGSDGVDKGNGGGSLISPTGVSDGVFSAAAIN